MTLTIVEGPQRGGKTSVMSYIGLLAYEDGRPVITNNETLVYPHIYIEDPWSVVANYERLDQCEILFDEGHNFFDSRMSMSKLNRAWSYFMLQTTKRDIEVVVTTHALDMLDVRMRRNMDHLIKVRYKSGYFVITHIPVGECLSRGIVRMKGKRRDARTFLLEAKPLWLLHKTRYRVRMPEALSPERK